jgi:hypothetical protein
VAVVERLVEGGMLSVRHLERMELGTPYTKVAERLCEIMMHPALDGNSRLVVDATGVGRPVVDLLRSVGMGVNISAVTITGGDAARGRGEEWHVPRQDLLGHLQVLLEKGELKIARKLKEAEALVRELEAMRVTGEGREHDDLVLAVALACWRGRMGTVGFRARPLLGIPPYCSGL